MQIAVRIILKVYVYFGHEKPVYTFLLTIGMAPPRAEKCFISFPPMDFFSLGASILYLASLQEVVYLRRGEEDCAEQETVRRI